MNDFNRTRDEILKEAISTAEHPVFTDRAPSVSKELSIQILQLEVLLDIRDALWRIEGKEGVRKWGPKL